MFYRTKKLIFFLSVFFTVGWSQSGCSAQELTVMSYNIRYASPNDGPNLWQNRKEEMIQTLLEIKPNLIGLQEVVHLQLIDLTSGMKDYSYVGVGREDGKTKGEYSPILYRKEDLKLLDSDTFWLSETPNQISVGWDAALERVCTYARFLHLKTGKEFWLFNTHFDHVGVYARVQATRLILSKIKLLNKDKLAVIITGDFNLEPEEKPIKILQAAFEDVQQKLSVKAANYGTFTGFDVENYGDRRIDYIFQNGFELLKADHLWLKTTNDLWLSDHHPVISELVFIN